MFVLDTNFLIYYAGGETSVANFFSQHTNDLLYVPSVVITEFLAYPSLSPKDISDFKNVLSNTVIINLDSPLAEIAGNIKREYGLKLADAVLAASAQVTGSTLVTRNVRDFKKVSGLKLLKI